ncbi:uncharacterized protein [Ambystoma mexicanum]|uniref:uncharacterized protein n=1 Tax=Ambystoma mexicanum TaxID=8296 RepID=UPI0037E7DB13
MMDPSTDQQAEAELPLVHEEQKMFEPLCERLLCAVSNLQSSLSEMLDLKDELISLGLPSSLTSRLSISAGRLFRSVSDLSVPSMELVRLVQVHSTPWEQKKQILEKLHRNYERKQSYLSLAIRRLQVLEAQSRSVARYQRIGNWERLFAKLMSAQGVGQRWKLRVEALRRTAMSGDMPELAIENLQQPQDVDIISHPHESEGSMAFSERNTPVKTLSDYIGADFAQEDEEETQRRSVESNRASQSPVSEDGNAPLFIETQETGAQTEIETEERETWTGESMTHRFLCVSVSPVLGGSGKGFSCRLTYGQQTHHVKLPALPTPRPPQPLPLTKKITIQEKGSVLATRKTPAAAPTRGVGTPYRDNPPGILRRGASSPRIESTLEINSDEVRFELSSCGQTKEILMNLALYHEAEGITATGEVPIPSDVPEALTIKVPLLGAGARSRSPYATLDLNLHHEEEVLPRWRDKATQAWSVHDVVREATGIDLHLTSPADLQRMLQPSPEVLEASTSPFPLPPEPLCQDSSTSPMPGPRHCLPEEAVSRPETDYQQVSTVAPY